MNINNETVTTAPKCKGRECDNFLAYATQFPPPKKWEDATNYGYCRKTHGRMTSTKDYCFGQMMK